MRIDSQKRAAEQICFVICEAGAYLLRYVKIVAQNFGRKTLRPKRFSHRLTQIDEKSGLEIAIKEGRAFVSHNVRDFNRLHSIYSERHYGIVLSEQMSLSILLRRCLYFLSQETKASAMGKLFWLSQYEPPQNFSHT